MFWKFGEYETANGVNELEEWLLLEDEKHPDVRPFLRNALLLLGGRRDWSKLPLVGFLEREHEGLIEVRLTIRKTRALPKRMYRPVGFIRHGEEWNEFVFLTGCQKFENGRLVPAEAFDHALDLKRQWENGHGRIIEHR